MHSPMYLMYCHEAYYTYIEKYNYSISRSPHLLCANLYLHYSSNHSFRHFHVDLLHTISQNLRMLLYNNKLDK